jgi:hypothetical protein
MLNILFSSTRQWNPGDEFILCGVRRLLDSVGLRYNALLFNRHPDVRAAFQTDQLFAASRVPSDFWSRHETRMIQANLRFGSFDNSVKPGFDYGVVDWVVLAGTPEWHSPRLSDLYSGILRHHVPVMILGVGGGCDIRSDGMREVISKAKAFTVREADTLAAATAAGFAPTLLPCPALLAVDESSEKRVTKVERVGLIYQASIEESVIWNGASKRTQDYVVGLLRIVMDRWPEFEYKIICHYADEVPLAQRDFPGLEILYSFDSSDYGTIYGDCDFVVGPRVHGIGIAASLGIPGVALVHDQRGATCEGFIATMVEVGAEESDAIGNIARAFAEAPERSAQLSLHKKRSMAAYQTVVRRALASSAVLYDQKPEPAPRPYKIEEVVDLVPILDWLRCKAPGEFLADPMSIGMRTMALLADVRNRAVNIEIKLDNLRLNQSANVDRNCDKER